MANFKENTQYLSAELQSKIKANPTNTTLRTDKDNFNAYKKLLPQSAATDLPSEFNGRQVWQEFLIPVMNQGTCGSCWAFASTGTLANRFNIQSKGKLKLVLSPVELILCDWHDKIGPEILKHPHSKGLVKKINQTNRQGLNTLACYGNSLIDAVRFLYVIGTVTGECLPYTKSLVASNMNKYDKLPDFSTPKNLPLCREVTGPFGDMCDTQKPTPARFYKCNNYYGLYGNHQNGPGGSELQLRLEIYKWGPIAAGMKIYPDFYEFDAKNDIYEWNGKDKQVGGHAVEIVGWGIENNKPYWQIKNSWGADWGDNGYFKMIRGVNNCELESNCISLQPDFFNPIDFKLIQPVNLKIINSMNRLYNASIRHVIATNTNLPAGGIDIETGYSRRTMTKYPNLDLTRPVDFATNWETFTAGKVGNTHTILKNMSVSNPASLFHPKYYTWFYVLLGIIVVITIISVILLVKKK